MRLSFSVASRKPTTTTASKSAATSAFESSNAAAEASSASKQFVTEFDPSKLPTTQTLIIPPKPNEYKPFKKKLKTPDLPSAESGGLQFEVDSGLSIEQGPNSITYGLNVRKSNGGGGGGDSVGESLLMNYKEDVMRLPDDPGFEEFEDMPVDGFGAALLAGYGWKEGMGIGKNAKEDVKIVDYKKWTGKEGLGFQQYEAETIVSSKKDGKLGKDGSKGEEVVGVESGNGRREENGPTGSRERRDDRRERSSRRSGRAGRDDEDGRNGEEVVRVESGNGRREENGRIDEGTENRGVDRRDGSRHSGSRDRRDDRRERGSSRRRSGRVGRDEEDGRNGEEVVGVESANGRREENGIIDVGTEDRGVDRRDGSRHSGSRERRDDKRGHDSSSRRSGRAGRNEEDGRNGEEIVGVESGNGRREENGRIVVGTEDSGVDQRDGGRRSESREHVSSSRRNGRDGRDEEVRDSRRERRHRGGEDVGNRSRDDRKRGHREMKESERGIWVRSHIRVRVVSESVKGGTLYLKKGEVIDVAGPSCDILMDESGVLVQGVSQECLETALPKRGGPVLVLYGKHKGVYGNLMEKDADTETGVVRDADNHEMLNVRLEQIAEFIGDPSYIGY